MSKPLLVNPNQHKSRLPYADEIGGYYTVEGNSIIWVEENQEHADFLIMCRRLREESRKLRGM